MNNATATAMAIWDEMCLDCQLSREGCKNTCHKIGHIITILGQGEPFEIKCGLGDCDCEPDCGEWEGERSLCPHQRVYCPTCGQREER